MVAVRYGMVWYAVLLVQVMKLFSGRVGSPIQARMVLVDLSGQSGKSLSVRCDLF
jgi:hypothetical protein